MTIDKKYSILMSVYINNDLNDIKTSVRSIRSQLLQCDDVVVVLDGPVQNSVSEFITSNCSDWNILQLSENVGLGDALRVGLSRCMHKWVMRMDADDSCSSSRSERLLNALSELCNDDVAVIGSYITEYNPETQNTALLKYPLRYRSNGKVNYFRDPVGHSCSMINSDAVAEVGGYRRCLFFEDTYLWLRLLTRGYCFVTIPEPLYSVTVDNKFYARRSGLRYAMIELRNFFQFYSEGLITFQSLLLNVIGRPFIRSLPIPLLRRFYVSFLRTNRKRP